MWPTAQVASYSAFAPHRGSSSGRRRQSYRSDRQQYALGAPEAGGSIAPNGEIALVAEARAPLNRLDFGPRLDDCEEFYCILLWADFHVA